MGASQCNQRSIGLVILAAGASTRLGRPKQLLRYRGRGLLRHIAETAATSVCQPIVVVLGAHGEQLAGELRGLPVHVVENPRWPQGMGTSLRAGLEAVQGVDPGTGAVVIALCDQPRLSAEALDALVQAHRNSRCPIVASEYAGVLGVAALFDRSLFAEILALNDGGGAQEIIARHRGEACRVLFPDGAIDIDTPEDYARLLASAEGCDRSAKFPPQ